MAVIVLKCHSVSLLKFNYLLWIASVEFMLPNLFWKRNHQIFGSKKAKWWWLHQTHNSALSLSSKDTSHSPSGRKTSWRQGLMTAVHGLTHWYGFSAMLPHGAHAWPHRHTHILASRMPSSSCRHLNSDWSATFRRSCGLWRFAPAESGVSKPEDACLHVEEAFEFLPSCPAPLLWMMLLNVEALLTRKFHGSWKVCCLLLQWCGLEHCLAFHLPCLWHSSVNAVSLQVMFFSVTGILLVFPSPNMFLSHIHMSISNSSQAQKW